MTSLRTISIITSIATATMAGSPWAATDKQHESPQPSASAAVQLAQATPGNPGMGMGGREAMPGFDEQMKAMQQMHEKMLAAKTPEERNALMTEQMQLMGKGMNMMGGMGGMNGKGAGAKMGNPDDMAARQGMTEQRMDMMQSMMQLMMDRMPSLPAPK